MRTVIAVVVAYQPIVSTFLPLLEKLSLQVERIVVVDNSPRSDNRVVECIPMSLLETEKLCIVRLGGNFGIAVALNVGIKEVINCGADFVLLSDQDSLPADDMVKNLCLAYAKLTAQDIKVGAVGPTFFDLHTSLTYPFQAQLPGKFFYGHKAPTTKEPHVEALSLITSGSLIPVEVIRAVGPMREDFFIDHVDIEWCHRARSMGYHLFGTGWARMNQRMGEAHLRVWYLYWRNESEYSPARVYYRLRNFVALSKLGFIDSRWKVRNAWFCLGIVYTHTFFAKKQNAKHLLFAIKGVWHGLINHMGPYKEE